MTPTILWAVMLSWILLLLIVVNNDAGFGITLVKGSAVVYLKPKVNMTYEDGMAHCESIGAKLASIFSSSENQKAVLAANGSRALLSLNDRATEGIFLWLNGTGTGAFQNFAGIDDDNGEDCVELLNGEQVGQWNDFSCTLVKPVLCEIRGPTKAPSASPSRTPSRSPSRVPSRSPTKNPSRTPSTSPSRSPSFSHPTRTPSTVPSTHPTMRPSLGPSATPSAELISRTPPATDSGASASTSLLIITGSVIAVLSICVLLLLGIVWQMSKKVPRTAALAIGVE